MSTYNLYGSTDERLSCMLVFLAQVFSSRLQEGKCNSEPEVRQPHEHEDDDDDEEYSSKDQIQLGVAAPLVVRAGAVVLHVRLDVLHVEGVVADALAAQVEQDLGGEGGGVQIYGGGGGGDGGGAEHHVREVVPNYATQVTPSSTDGDVATTTSSCDASVGLSRRLREVRDRQVRGTLHQDEAGATVVLPGPSDEGPPTVQFLEENRRGSETRT